MVVSWEVEGEEEARMEMNEEREVIACLISKDILGSLVLLLFCFFRSVLYS